MTAARDRTPEAGVAFGGVRRDVSLADVVAAIGTRSPTVAHSPKVLRQSFVFVSTSGSPAEADLAKLERIRAAFPSFYAAGTEGRGEGRPADQLRAPMDPLSLAGRTAVVTGAGRIGAATARIFAEAGAQLALDRDAGQPPAPPRRSASRAARPSPSPST